jgi:UDP-glucose 4-epimerase
MSTQIITGAAGFIGSHLADALLERGDRVIGIDNFSRGSRANLALALKNARFELLTADLADANDCERLVGQLGARFSAKPGSEHISQLWHLAANSDIPAGVADLNVDLRDTFLSTVGSLRIARQFGIPDFFFTSTSAVYGEHEGQLTERSGPLLPISNYGAMKLASEAAISAATSAYLRRSRIFRLPNVVGARSTHGLIFDMYRKLAASPSAIEVLGDGTQCKQYLHVSELIDAALWIADHSTAPAIDCFNLGPSADAGITVRRIMEILLETAESQAVPHYSEGDRGWVGDVPHFAYSVEKLNALGWRAKGSSEDAIRRACVELRPRSAEAASL